MVLNKKSEIFSASVSLRNFYEDQYAKISFVESIPCVKIKMIGVPQSSDHYQLVQGRMMDLIHEEMENYCRLHLLTDNSKAGIVLDEDIAYYRDIVIPQIEKAGVRFHAIVLPESAFVRKISASLSQSGRKLRVEYFNTVSGASKWLKHR